MTIPNESEIISELAQLQQLFLQKLPVQIADMKLLWSEVSASVNQQAATDITKLAELHRMAHSLAGSGGTFGAESVSSSARELEQQLKLSIAELEGAAALSSSQWQPIDRLLTQLLDDANNWQPSVIPYIAPDITPGQSPQQQHGNLIYLAEDDELLAADLTLKLQQANYQVRHFVELSAFEAAYQQQIPAVIIMDIIFQKSDATGADLISKLKSKQGIIPPVIFISVREDIETRLAAARAGARRYFTKPIDEKKLILTVDGLTAKHQTEPFRVLIIDDDETLLKYYQMVLSDAGMQVVALSQPLQALTILADFKPDIVLLDVYMPDCTGPELAQVIRQDDDWTLMPIMFLSTESDLDIQLAAMNLGGDDFLVKPVDAGHLVAAVEARAKRARWSKRLNTDLQEALRESKFQLVTMDQHDIVSTADISGQITSVNDRFCEISGYSREELLGKNHNLLKSERHSRSFYNDLWATISSGKIWHGSICNLSKNGDEYWVESTIVPFLDDRGKPYKYVSARTDITVLRNSEERLSRSQEFANMGTWDWNIHTGELFWSDLIWPLFGYEKAKTAMTYDNFMAAVHPDDRQMVADAVNDCVQKGTDYNIEHRVIWSDGSEHWLQESGDVVRTEQGKALHMLGVVQDITDRKQTERDLMHAHEEAENANRAKSQFLSSMSHELRTPLNAIIGFSQLMKLETDQPLTEIQKDNVNEISTAGEHLLELINEVLDLSKIEAGHIELSIGTVVLGEVIAESIQLIKPLAEKRGIDICLSRDGVEIGFEELFMQNNTARADSTRLKQVLLNLLSNAVKYNIDKGKVTICCQHMTNKMSRISITDTGAGLSPDQQLKLFKPFERIGAEHSSIEGTGIGLVITKKIVEIMGGAIGVDSQPGKGCSFWFELPSDTALSDKQIGKKTPDADAERQLKQKKHDFTVLYIEDNPANLRLVSQSLGYRKNIFMWSAHEPLLGLELATEHKPSLILLDINLPGLNGFEVLKKLRQNALTAHIPVIAVSANAMPGDIEKGMAAGFDDYITKPINVVDLLNAVDSRLAAIQS
ncbi:MAG: response regulator [Gammaproteobacteria bacterium]|nr:response regulator [Gammaproteobacteria bacterium]